MQSLAGPHAPSPDLLYTRPTQIMENHAIHGNREQRCCTNRCYSTRAEQWHSCAYNFALAFIGNQVLCQFATECKALWLLVPKVPVARVRCNQAAAVEQHSAAWCCTSCSTVLQRSTTGIGQTAARVPKILCIYERVPGT